MGLYRIRLEPSKFLPCEKIIFVQQFSLGQLESGQQQAV